MAEYHIGLGAFAIYAGRLNKDKTMWLDKSDVTEEAIMTGQTILKKFRELEKDKKGVEE